MENTQFVKDCQNANLNEVIKRPTLSFDELFNLKYPAEVKDDPAQIFFWNKFEIYAITKKDFKMMVWQGHGKKPEFIDHICKAGTKVRVWMVSKMGDIGITDNLINPVGYDCRGIDNNDLYDWEFIRMEEKPQVKKDIVPLITIIHDNKGSKTNQKNK